MNSRPTWLLLLVAAALGAFIFFFERHLQPAGELTLPGRVLPELKTSAVTSITVRPAQRVEINVIQTNQAWQLTRPINYPADAASIDALLQTFENISWNTRITAGELKDRPNYSHEFGFDAAQFTLLIQQGDHQWQITIGNRSPYGDELFFQVVGRDEIYLVSAELLRVIPRTANDWREPTLADLKNVAFDRLILTNGVKTVELQRDPTNKLWQLVRPLAARADSPKIEEMLLKLQSLRFSQFVTDDPKADLENFGLQPPGLSLTFANSDETLLGLQFGKSPSNHADQVFARRADTPSIGLVPKEQLAAWRGSLEDFRDRHLMSLAGAPVDEVEVHASEDFTLDRTTNNIWQITAPTELPADLGLVRDFLGSLGKMEIAQFVKSVVTEPDLPNYGLATPARQVILRTRGTDTNTILVQLDFGATTNDTVYVRRSDETAVYAVRLADYENLPATGWQLRNRRIWSFKENEVVKLSIRQNGKVRELLHNGSNSWSFAVGSQGIINNFAIEEAAGTLGELSAAAWTARGDVARAQYGFTEISPRISVDVKRGDKTETLSLDLGGTASPSQLQYGAVTLDGETWICELPARIAEMISAYLTVPAGP